jgi:hypothetical protein
MLQNRYVIGGAIIAVLLVLDIIRFIFSDWGLITVRVQDAPLGQVIKSIERQGWVTIYTNMDLSTTTVTMDVIKVPLAEAMESLAVNVAVPPPPADSSDGGGRPRGGGGAQWHLAFFTAPTSAQVKQEIYNFQSGAAPDDDTKIYSYQTPLQMLASDAGMPAADPRLQVWSGVTTAAPAPPAPATGTDPAADGQPDSPPPPPSSVQDYLNALAQAADIWIMAPSSWDPKIPEPAAASSIMHAVKSVVSSGHGAVTQAFILYARPPGPRGGPGGGRGFGMSDTGWADRMSNAINGLPPEARPDALAQLKVETSFRQQLRAAPPEQRRDLMRRHFMSRLGAMDNWRRSPERRAQMYQRAVSNRETVRGQ